MSGRQKSRSSAKPTTGLTTPKTVSSSSGRGTTTSAERNNLRSKSPLSISRAEEKDELCHLNDRLSNYITYVKSLEEERETLHVTLKSQNETQKNDTNKLKALYEPEIKQLRKALDKAANDLTQADIDVKKAKNEVVDANCKVEKFTKDVNDLRKQLEKAQYHLQRETEARVKSENKAQSLKEELGFALKINEEQSDKMRPFQLDVIAKQKAEYDSKLADELRRFRATTLKELDAQRNSIEDNFKQKLAAQKASLDCLQMEKNDLRKECAAIRLQRDTLERELSKMRDVAVDLEKDLESQRIRFEKKLEDAALRDKNLQDELSQRLQEYSDLMAIKIQLDQEIMAYRKLIEGEESRLHLPASDMDSCFQYVDLESNRKRRRLDVDLDYEEEDEEEETFEFHQKGLGAIILDEVDTSGDAQYIKLKSQSVEDIKIGGWVLRFESGNNEATFVFPKNALLRAASETTVWNCNASNAKNKPTTDYIMKQVFNKEKHGDMNVSFVNEEGIEQASIEVTRHVTLTGRRIARHRRNHEEDKCMVM